MLIVPPPSCTMQEILDGWYFSEDTAPDIKRFNKPKKYSVFFSESRFPSSLKEFDRSRMLIVQLLRSNAFEEGLLAHYRNKY